MEKSTNELLEILKSKKNYNEFLEEEIGELCFSSLSEYLEMLVNEKKLKKSDIINKSNLDKNYAYQIFNGNKTNPSRNKVIMLAFGMGLSLAETRKLLKIASLSDLYIRSPRDSLIMYCLNNRISLIECNEYLCDFNFELLE
ncbi:MAG: hypothetical protein E7570_04135 [Ruminococcaceae bacterium]|nr:hypothetical protein [Oscillospiraceae bacterium]